MFRSFPTKSSNSLRYLSKFCDKKAGSNVPFSTFFMAGGTVALYTAYQCFKNQSVLAYDAKVVSFYRK